MRTDQLDGFVTFVVVARERSFTAAGHALGVTPSAVSQGINQLESRLGVRLFDRTTRSVQLTEAGTALLARVEPAVDELARAAESAAELAARPAGTLRLNVPHVAARILVEPILAGFLKAHPGIAVEIGVDDAFVDIVAGRYDAGIRLGESLEKDMVAVRFGPAQETALVASPRYLKKHGIPRTPADLASHECIRFRLRTTGGIYAWELESAGEDLAVEVDGRLTVDDVALGIAAAEDGIGIVYAFKSYVDAALIEGRLVRVLADYSPKFPGFHLYYSSRRLMPAKLRAFVDFCAAAHAPATRKRPK